MRTPFYMRDAMIDLQKASYAKRLFAFLADLIAASILTVGIYLLMTWIMNTDAMLEKYNGIVHEYEERFGVTFNITQEQYDGMDEEAKKHYREAVDAVNGDEEANRAMTSYYTAVFVIFASGILLSMLILGFAIPLILGDGRTLGKKLFGLGVMKIDYTKVTPVMMFVRSVIGKGVMEILLPVMLILTSMSGVTGIFGLIMLGIFAVAEVVSIVKTPENRLLHDIIAGTAVVDWESQMIFDTAADRDEYIKTKQEEREQSRLY